MATYSRPMGYLDPHIAFSTEFQPRFRMYDLSQDQTGRVSPRKRNNEEIHFPQQEVSAMEAEDSVLEVPRGDEDSYQEPPRYAVQQPRMVQYPTAAIYPGDFLLQFRKIYTEPPAGGLPPEVYSPNPERIDSPKFDRPGSATFRDFWRKVPQQARPEPQQQQQRPAVHQQQPPPMPYAGSSLFAQDPLMVPIRPGVLASAGPAPVTSQLFSGFAAPAGFPTAPMPVAHQPTSPSAMPRSPPESRLIKYLSAQSPIGTPAEPVTAAMSNLSVSGPFESLPPKAAPGSPCKPIAAAPPAGSSPFPLFWNKTTSTAGPQPPQQPSPPSVPGTPPGGSPPFSPVRKPRAASAAAAPGQQAHPQQQQQQQPVPVEAPVAPLRRGPSINFHAQAVPQGSVPAAALESHLKGRSAKSAKLDHGADHSSSKGFAASSAAARHQRGQETNVTRLNSRQRQIDIGKNTIGYKMYLQMVPRDRRSRQHPKTPDKLQLCSKRSWDGQIRKWRRQIHLFDPDISEEEKKALQDLMIREALSGQTDDEEELELVSDAESSDWEDEEATSRSKQLALNALLRSVHRKAMKLEASGSSGFVMPPELAGSAISADQ